MKSFHKLCFCSNAALVIFKRGGGLRGIAEPGSIVPGAGLSLRGCDPRQGGRDFVAELRQLQAQAGQVMSPPIASAIAESLTELGELGIDLEYATRA